MGTGAGAAIRRDRSEDETRIVAVQLIPAEPERLQPVRTVVVDEYVRPANQAAECFAAGGAIKVQGHAAFARVQVQEEAAPLGMRLVAGEGAAPSRRVAGWRLLDLHDVGAHVSEQLPAIGAGHHRCVFDYSDTAKACRVTRVPPLAKMKESYYGERRRRQMRPRLEEDYAIDGSRDSRRDV